MGLIVDGADEVVALELLAVGDGDGLDGPGARRLHDHLHLHGGQHGDGLALLHFVALLHLDGWKLEIVLNNNIPLLRVKMG